jgi:hypothetical protein
MKEETRQRLQKPMTLVVVAVILGFVTLFTAWLVG